MQALRNILGSRWTRRIGRVVGLALAFYLSLLWTSWPWTPFQKFRAFAQVLNWCETNGTNLTGCVWYGLRARQFNGITFVGDGISGITGDLGAQINAAYVSLPATGGVIQVIPRTASTACYSFSTPITFTTAGKYVRLESLSTSAPNATGGTCLNYTPTTATAAITVDYATSNSNPSSDHGLTNIKLINNNCTTSGGCGSSATGLLTGVTNNGNALASMSNVTIQGFGVGYQNDNQFSDDLVWINPVFIQNTTAIQSNSSETGLSFLQGTIAGNGKVFICQASCANAMQFYATQIFGQTTHPDFDYTLNTSPGLLDFVSVHLENSAAATNAHFVSGNVNLIALGGITEDDTSGAQDWFYNLTGQNFVIEAMGFSKAAGTMAELVNMPAGSERGKITGYIFSAGHFTNWVAGGQSQFVSLDIMPGNNGQTMSPIFFEAPIISGIGRNCGLVGSFALSAGWGTTATVTGLTGSGQSGCRITITASGTGQAANPTLTWTLPTPYGFLGIFANIPIGKAVMEGGTGSNTLFQQTTVSATAPIWTFQGTPGAGLTYIVDISF